MHSRCISALQQPQSCNILRQEQNRNATQRQEKVFQCYCRGEIHHKIIVLIIVGNISYTLRPSRRLGTIFPCVGSQRRKSQCDVPDLVGGLSALVLPQGPTATISASDISPAVSRGQIGCTDHTLPQITADDPLRTTPPFDTYFLLFPQQFTPVPCFACI